jgi:UDPglucose 6-dehydrogenase
MKISIVGTGYVGLVTGVALSEVGHDVTCVDIDEVKVNKMRKGISPIYEPGLEAIMAKNIEQGRLHFTSSFEAGFRDAKAIYIAVGTPQKENGQADLQFIDAVARNIAENVKNDIVVITKSTVPVGTNDHIRGKINDHNEAKFQFEMVSNPEFLREGSAVHDTFNGDRMVIGFDNEKAGALVEQILSPFNIPIFKTDIRSAEMIKYASNAYLATKISFINEISNICEKLDANIEDVALGMGLDNRIGTQFLNAGIGYGGSCFPKDTKALVQIAGNVEHDFELLKAVINVNNAQQSSLVRKAKQQFGSLENKKVALLGLAFKPNTDDMREAASIAIAQQLVQEGADILAFDPIAMENAKKILPGAVKYADSIDEAIEGADMALIVTEWDEIKAITFDRYKELMEKPVIFDGRNCYDIKEAERAGVNYHSMGRKAVEGQPSKAGELI